MAINFSDKILITNPTSYHLGRGIVCLGVAAIAIGIISRFTGDILLPALGWCAMGTPTIVVGAMFVTSGLTRR